MAHPIFAPEPIKTFGPTIFLAGPTPRAPRTLLGKVFQAFVRNNRDYLWRSDAWNYINLEMDDTHNVTALIPEPRDGKFKHDYDDQVEWEYEGLHKADVIIFWVPRKKGLPGFTTNVEFGYWVKDEKTFYGRPPQSFKTRYLNWLYRKERGRKPHSDLYELLHEAVDYAIAHYKQA